MLSNIEDFDFQTAVKHISDEISELILNENEYNDFNYNCKSIHDEEIRYQQCQERMEKLRQALDSCNKFLDGRISLQEFCIKIIVVGLERFLNVLPPHVLLKYDE